MFFVKAKGILSPTNGMNIYRGCTHGCIYCDSRSLCYNMTHEFTDIEVKENAVELLAQTLAKKRKKCMIGTGAMCDPYMHCEEKLLLTRRCMETVLRYGFGMTVQTKSDLALRDGQLMREINDSTKFVIQTTLTTYDEKLCSVVEPNVCGTYARYEMLKRLGAEGIPSVVWISPLLPHLNDTVENMSGLLEYCLDAKVKGIIYFGAGLTLRSGNREYYYACLDKSFPGLSEIYKKEYGDAYECASKNSATITKLFHETCEKYGILDTPEKCFGYLHEFPERGGVQLSLFD